MLECGNAEMKDLLPDLLHEQGSAEERTRIRSHLESCESCRADLDLLRRIRAAAPAPRIDAERIASSVPRYATRWGRAGRSPLLRIAAAIVLVAGGGIMLSDAPDTDEPGPTVVVAPVAPEPLAPTPPAESATRGASRAAPASELAFGDHLSDLSDSDLRELLSELGGIEAVTSEETDIVVLPALDRRGGR